MTWLSFDDGYTRQPVWENLSYESRWHFHALAEFCGATRRYSGRVRLADALRCSDVPDPQRCLTELFQSGLVVNCGPEVEVADIDNYLPPEGQRDESLLPRKRANQVAYRRRRCENGRHDKNCPPKTCPVKLSRDQSVTGNAGTGRDGSGSTKTEGLVETRISPDIWFAAEHEVREPEGRAETEPRTTPAVPRAANASEPGEAGTRRQPIAPLPKNGNGSNMAVPVERYIPDASSAGAKVAHRYAREDEPGSNGHRRPSTIRRREALRQEVTGFIAARSECTTNQLQANIGGNRQNLLEVLGNLTDAGVVEAIRDPSDRRKVSYRLAAS